MLIAQLSDPHIMDEGVRAYGVLDTMPYLQRAIDRVLRLDPAPDLVLVTGDLVDGAKPSEYARLATALARLPMPYFLIPGNHDKRDNLRSVFTAPYLPRDGYLHYTIEDWPLRLIGLDTTIPGQGGGAMDAPRLAWLDVALAAAPEKPTLIFMHHPPFVTDIAHLDRVGLAGRDGFAAVLARFDNVEAVTCGHVHRAMSRRLANTVALTSPSTAHQAMLDLRPDGASEFDLAPPGFLVHHWTPEARLRSHVVTIGEFPGPYYFSADKNRAAGRV